MDNAVWAVFYDLPEKGRDEYLSWFHEVHIPEKLSRPGYRWAAHYENAPAGERFQKVLDRLGRSDDPALASGTGFIALFGGETTRTFLDPSPSQLMDRASPETREMIERRIRPLGLILCEEWRVDGPDADKRGPDRSLAPAIQMGRYDGNGNDEDLEAWYAQERMIAIERTRGCVGARKLLAAVGDPRHSVLYEFVSLEDRETHFVPIEETIWSQKVQRYLIHPPGSPVVGRRIWPLA